MNRSKNEIIDDKLLFADLLHRPWKLNFPDVYPDNLFSTKLFFGHSQNSINGNASMRAMIMAIIFTMC